MIVFYCAVIFAITLTSVLGHVAHWTGSSQLHPVHGLYVKPSADGTTGDLYVAATEDSGVKTQWLTDAPINFLSAVQQPAVPVSFATTYPQEETATIAQKRAVVAPPIQYAYAMPVASTDSNPMTTYPYPISISSVSTNPESSTLSCPMDAAKANIPQYSPFQFFYPQMMSAYANAMNILKDAGLSEDTASSVMTQASPMWSPYTYPTYVMVDPATWTQSQTTTTPPTSSNSVDTS